jgi:hypothetical protein
VPVRQRMSSPSVGSVVVSLSMGSDGAGTG